MITWEEAVEKLRQDPDQRELVLSCYYDDPLAGAARRFEESEEWAAVRELLPPPGRVLDIGAGRGISSAAFSSSGWMVTALEPDPGNLVGGGAIRALAESSGRPIEVVEDWGESLPFPDESFDLVYGRAVFHHARDLDAFCTEACRVLKPGGKVLMTREHVLSREEDLDQFLNAHPLHRLYGGEAAYTLDRYTRALESGGLSPVRVIGPKSSPINFFPETSKNIRAALRLRMSKRIGRIRGILNGWRRKALVEEALLWEEKMKVPGRLYTFLAEKPLRS
ncbi:MAG: class I SAM-dependent methyltransferase [Verrucomicrobiae bacterium]|nr:class I SAM-dependent methyltransferase [Verrucomicrobiae bacterium]